MFKRKRNPFKTFIFRNATKTLSCRIRTRIPVVDDISGVKVSIRNDETGDEISMDWEDAFNLSEMIREKLKPISWEDQLKEPFRSNFRRESKERLDKLFKERERQGRRKT